MTICGNVTMTQLALGIDPEPLSMAPFIVTTHELPETRAADFGVGVHPRAPAFVFPSLGAYVGGDIVAGMLATGLTRDRRIRLFIDVGTNSEIALGCERARARHRGAGRPRLRGRPDPLRHARRRGRHRGREDRRRRASSCRSSATPSPSGMCGSGLVDCVSELVHSGLLDHSGRFIPDEEAAERLPALAPRLTKIGEERVFVMHWRGEDPAESSSSPSATCASCSSPRRRSRRAGRSCCASSASSPATSSRCCWPGRFGAYLSPASAVRIGLVPRLALPRIVSAGNVAGEGAKIAPLAAARARRGALDPARGRVRRAVGARRLQRRCSSTSWRSRDERAGRGHRVRRARRPRAPDRPPARLARRPRHPVPALLHNRPEQIARRRRAQVDALRERYDVRRVRLRRLRHATARSTPPRRHGVERLRGEHCYDLFARDEVPAALAAEPGTYFLTDFLARTFEHTVVRELGLDRWPELRDDYFGSYTRVALARAGRHPGDRARRASARRSGSACRSRCAPWATAGSSASSSGWWLRRGEVWRSQARPARAVGRWRAGPVAGHGLRLRKLRLRGVSRATRPNDVLARPGSTVRVAIRRRLLLRGRSSCAESVRHCSPPGHRATVVWLRFGEPTVRWAPPGTVMRTPRRR